MAMQGPGVTVEGHSVVDWKGTENQGGKAGHLCDDLR